MEVDQRVVVEDLGVVEGDEAHAAHIRGQRVHLIHTAGGLQAVVPPTEIQDLELVRVDIGVLGILDVDTTHPVALLLQAGHEMMTNESTGAGNQNPSLRLHDLTFLSIEKTDTTRRPRVPWSQLQWFG